MVEKNRFPRFFMVRLPPLRPMKERWACQHSSHLQPARNRSMVPCVVFMDFNMQANQRFVNREDFMLRIYLTTICNARTK